MRSRTSDSDGIGTTHSRGSAGALFLRNGGGGSAETTRLPPAHRGRGVRTNVPRWVPRTRPWPLEVESLPTGARHRFVIVAAPGCHDLVAASFNARRDGSVCILEYPSRAFPSSFWIAVSRHTSRNDCIILSGARGKCAGEADQPAVEIDALRRGGGLSLALREYRLHTLLRSSTCRSHDVLWWRRRRCCRARAKHQQTKY